MHLCTVFKNLLFILNLISRKTNQDESSDKQGQKDKQDKDKQYKNKQDKNKQDKDKQDKDNHDRIPILFKLDKSISHHDSKKGDYSACDPVKFDPTESKMRDELKHIRASKLYSSKEGTQFVFAGRLAHVSKWSKLPEHDYF